MIHDFIVSKYSIELDGVNYYNTYLYIYIYIIDYYNF